MIERSHKITLSSHFVFLVSLQTTLFVGEATHSTAPLSVIIQLKSYTKLEGVKKVKLHSHTPGTCIRAMLWICYDQRMEDSRKLSSRSEHSQEERPMKSSTSNGRPTVDGSQLDSLKRENGLINPLNLRPTKWRIKRAALLSSNNQASSSTTPKTCELS